MPKSPKLPKPLSSDMIMYMDFPDMAVEAMDAFHGRPWAEVLVCLKQLDPKASKVRLRQRLVRMMLEVENSEDHVDDPVWDQTDDEPFDKFFPTWSKFRVDMEKMAKVWHVQDEAVPDDYHGCVQYLVEGRE